MKKHQFVQVDWLSTVKLSVAEERKMKQWLDLASKVIEKLGPSGLFPKNVQGLKVSLLICGDQRIKKLNQDYRQKDKVTDVLSFPAHEDLRKKSAAKEVFLGDMAICFPQAKRQAQEFDIGAWDEFIHLYFHGILHLLGYDHEVSVKEEKIMQAWEDQALSLFSKLRTK